MQLVTDLHLHSKYSRAVSPQMVIPEMAKWAKIKGINLLGTGDFTHPLWFSELREWLEEKDGILEMRNEKWEAGSARPPASSLAGEVGRGSEKCEVRFLLTTEISSIYSQGGKTRKIHNLIVAPSFSSAEKISQELKNRGCNLLSDGRPIIGLSAKDLLNLVLSVDEKCLFIPCHIWTPWFSLYGSKSGFDSVQECFGELSKYIYAVETGLSSDPDMNWRVPDLDQKQIVSFGDAHSLQKLGREATALEIEDTKILRYEDIRRAIIGKWEGGNGKLEKEMGSENSEDQIISPQNQASNFPPHISYTVEFYPEEGKYHWTGHRKCGIVLSPEETAKKGMSCPVCGKGLTVGVMERVKALGPSFAKATEGKDRVGDRVSEVDEFGVRWTKEKPAFAKASADAKAMAGKAAGKKERPRFVKLVPLAEIIAETLKAGESSQKVQQEFGKLIEILGSEIKILTRTSKEEIAKIGGEKLAEGIMKVRKGDIYISPGFDGEFGKVSVWSSFSRQVGEASAGKGKNVEQSTLF